MIIFALFQLAVLVAVLLLWSKRAAGLCLASMSLAWAVVLTLVSGHLVAGWHLLWVVPAAWLMLLVWRRWRATFKQEAGHAD
jgi:uncharacterized membrane protein